MAKINNRCPRITGNLPPDGEGKNEREHMRSHEKKESARHLDTLTIPSISWRAEIRISSL